MRQNRFNRKIQRKSKKQYAGSPANDEETLFLKALCKNYNFNDMDAATIRETINELPEACASEKVIEAFDMVKILNTGLWDVVLDYLRDANANNNLRNKVKEIINKFDEDSEAHKFFKNNLIYNRRVTDDEILKEFERVEEYWRSLANTYALCSPKLLNDLVKGASETADDELMSNIRTACVGQEAGRRSRQNRRRSYRKNM